MENGNPKNPLGNDIARKVIHYLPSGKLFASVRIGGKLIRRLLLTKSIVQLRVDAIIIERRSGK
jgi:hypothetical protein